jgi:hypothetical protein
LTFNTAILLRPIVSFFLRSTNILMGGTRLT